MTSARAEAGEAEQALLAAADDLFHQHGIAAARMADIRTRSGVSLRRIYSLHPTKADLVSAWLRHRHEEWLGWFRAEIAARRVGGASPVDAVFDALCHWLSETDFRGCGFINTLAERGQLTDEHREIIRHHKRAVVDALTEHTADPLALSVIVDGAIVQASIHRTTEPVDRARRAAHAVERAAAIAGTEAEAG